jgi:hypothetical protein
MRPPQKFFTAAFSAILVATSSAKDTTSPIEIRFCPASAVRTYPLESRREVQSLMLQNAAVINHGQPAFTVTGIDVELLQGDQAIDIKKLDEKTIQSQAERLEKGSILGNYVVIDHGQGEFSLYAHLKPGSVRVKTGDQVKAGNVIGKLGSSGNSTEPHLHFQITDRTDLRGAGIPMNFSNITILWADLPRPIQSGDIVIAK